MSGIRGVQPQNRGWIRAAVLRTLGVALATLVACSASEEEQAHEPVSEQTLAIVACDPAAPFEQPVPAFTGMTTVDGLTFSANGLTAYVSSKASSATYDIYVATRLSTADAFGPLSAVQFFTDSVDERAPSLSADGLRLYLHKLNGSFNDLGVATRSNVNSAFSAPSWLTNLNNASAHEQDPFFLSSANQLYYSTEHPTGTRNIYVSSFSPSTTPNHSNGVALSATVNDPGAQDYRPVLSSDGLRIYFASTRATPGGNGSGDVWTAVRPALAQPFGAATNLTALNSSFSDHPVVLSNDGCTLYFASNRDTDQPTNFRLYEARRGTSTPALVTTTLNILGNGSVQTTPFVCSTSCWAQAAPGSVVHVQATGQARWEGSCSAYGSGSPSSDGLLTFTNGGVCTVTFVASGAACDPNAAFGPISGVLTGNPTADGLTFTHDELTAYVSSKATTPSYDLFRATRPNKTSLFTIQNALTNLNTSADDRAPSLNDSGLRLYFWTKNTPTQNGDLLVASRATPLADFGTATALPGMNHSVSDEDPFFFNSESRIYFTSDRPTGDRDLWSSVRIDGEFTTPTKLGVPNTAYDFEEERRPILTPDGLTLYFHSDRIGYQNDTNGDIWITRRTSTSASFGTPELIAGLNSSGRDFPVALSKDLCTLYFASNRNDGGSSSQTFRLFQSRRGGSQCGASVDDGNPCTVDSCDPVLGALHQNSPAGTSCTDGNTCNGQETCNDSGVCLPGTPPNCANLPCGADNGCGGICECGTGGTGGGAGGSGTGATGGASGSGAGGVAGTAGCGTACGGAGSGGTSNGTGTCASDLDCEPGYLCGIGVGPGFGLAVGTNVCWPPRCEDMNPQESGCGIDNDPACGPCQGECVPKCAGRQCGPNGCGGTCGDVANGEICNPQGIRVPTPVPKHSPNFPAALPDSETAEVGTLAGSFQVTDRGAATYSIPIEVPPGRAGFQPKLALAYTGLKTEGLMGAGWQIAGLSAIARCASTVSSLGAVVPVSYSGLGFCLDGKQLLADPESEIVDGSLEFQTELESFSKVVARGITYVPGNGEGAGYQGPEYFEVFSKEGKTLFYGATDDSSLLHRGVKRVWALSGARDRAGNTIDIQYDTHDVQPHGGGRAAFALPIDTGELLPKSISYGGNGGGLANDTWVTFTYEARPDPKYHFVSGARGFSLRRLKTITTVVADVPAHQYIVHYFGGRTGVARIEECAGTGDRCKPGTSFGYHQSFAPDFSNVEWAASFGSTWSLLSVLDQNGDGRGDLLTKTGESYHVRRAEMLPDGTLEPTFITLPWTSAQDPALTADINGDGRDDIIDPRGKAFVSTGDSFTVQTFFPGLLLNLPPVSVPVKDAALADMDGDGRKDLIIAALNDVAVARGLPNSLADGVAYSGSPLPSSGCSSLVPLDVDGDGAEEVLCVPSSGSVQAISARATSEGLAITARPSGITRTAGSAVKSVDLNGDGLTDLLEQLGDSAGDMTVWENTGQDFIQRRLQLDLNGLGLSTRQSLSDALVFDYTGDGVHDIVFGTSHVLSLTGRYALTKQILGIPGESSVNLGGAVKVGDIEGDGSLDLLLSGATRDQSDSPTTTGLTEARGVAAQRGLLASIEDGLGKAIQIEYQTDTPVSWSAEAVRTYLPENCSEAGLSDDIACLSHFPPLVSEYSEWEPGDEGPQRGRRFVYSYQGARLGLKGRGFFGFSSRDIFLLDDSDQLARTTTKKFYATDPVRAGILQQSSVVWPTVAETWLASEHYTRERGSSLVEVATSARGRPFARTLATFEASEAFVDPESGSLPVPIWTREKTVTANEWGDEDESVTRVYRGAGAALIEELTVHTDYYPPELTSWQIGLPMDITTTSSRAGDAQSRHMHCNFDANGLLESIVREQDDEKLYLKMHFGRDNPYGNLDSVTSSDFEGEGGPDERKYSIVLDAREIYPMKITNPEGHVSEIAFDPRTGLPSVYASPNRVITRWAYDGLGRVTVLDRPDDVVTIQYAASVDFESPILGEVQSVMQTIESNESGGIETTRIDAFGRIVATSATGFEGAIVSQEFAYDWNGRALDATLPHVEDDSSQGSTEYHYDAVGRLSAMVAADGAITEFGYASSPTLKSAFSPWFGDAGASDDSLYIDAVLNPRLNVEARVRDHQGGLVGAVESESLTSTGIASAHISRTTVAAFGLPREVRDQLGNLVTMAYDGVGRVTDIVDPDLGLEHRELSAWGETVEVTDNAGETRSLVYDRVGRLRRMVDSDHDLIAEWEYDGPVSKNEVGRLTSTFRQTRPGSSAGNSIRYEYEEPIPGLLNTGRLERVTREIPSGSSGVDSLVTEVGYDEVGRLKTLTYPALPQDGLAAEPFVVQYVYDDTSGILRQVRDAVADDPFWTLEETEQGFLISQELFGNGIHQQKQYYSVSNTVDGCDGSGHQLRCMPGSLWTIYTTRPVSGPRSEVVVQDVQYKYDLNLNVKQRQALSGIGFSGSTESFAYDGFDQVKSWTRTSGSAVIVRGYDYDLLGNITFQTGLGSYDYEGSGRPHAVGQIGTTEYDYDANGNQEERRGPLVEQGFQKLFYNDFSMPWRITTGQAGTAFDTDFEYDAFENRIAKRSPGSETLYAGDVYERTTTAAGSEHRYKVFAHERQIAQVTKRNVGGVVASRDTVYLHEDGLGSAAVLTNSDGSVAERRTYGPFGATEEFDSASVNAGFTGHEHDQELGLINMRGRMYDPKLGQFIQPDPFVTSSNPRALNRYAYVMNNPLKFTDPSGFWLNFGFGFITGRNNSGPNKSGVDPINPGEEPNEGMQDPRQTPGEKGGAMITSLGGGIGDDGASSGAPVELPDAGQSGGVVATKPGGGAAPPGTFQTPGGGAALGTPPPPGAGGINQTNLPPQASMNVDRRRGGFIGTPPFAAAACAAAPEVCGTLAGGGLVLGPLLVPAVGAAVLVAGGLAIWKAVEKATSDETPNDQSKRHTTDQEAVIDMAKEAQREGLSEKDAAALLDLAKKAGVEPVHDHIDTDHWRGGPHIRVGPINHIPVKR